MRSNESKTIDTLVRQSWVMATVVAVALIAWAALVWKQQSSIRDLLADVKSAVDESEKLKKEVHELRKETTESIAYRLQLAERRMTATIVPFSFPEQTGVVEANGENKRWSVKKFSFRPVARQGTLVVSISGTFQTGGIVGTTDHPYNDLRLLVDGNEIANTSMRFRGAMVGSSGANIYRKLPFNLTAIRDFDTNDDEIDFELELEIRNHTVTSIDAGIIQVTELIRDP